jgi:heme exporter protein C
MASVTSTYERKLTQKSKGEDKTKAGLNWFEVLTWAMLVAFLLTFLFIFIAPTDATLKYSQRIFYFHLPANIMCFAAFFVYFIGGIGYWRTRQRKWDIVMVSGLEIGIFFAAIGIGSGSIWAKYAWNTFWTWDPRLTTVTIMLIVYIAGLMLRNSTEDPAKKAALSAAFGIIGFVDVPIVFFSTRWFPRGLHPVIFLNDQNGNANALGLEGFMVVTLITGMIAMALLFVWLLTQRIRLEQTRDDVAALAYSLQEDL